MLDLIEVSNGMVLVLMGISMFLGVVIGTLLIMPEVVKLQSQLRNLLGYGEVL